MVAQGNFPITQDIKQMPKALTLLEIQCSQQRSPKVCTPGFLRCQIFSYLVWGHPGLKRHEQTQAREVALLEVAAMSFARMNLSLSLSLSFFPLFLSVSLSLSLSLSLYKYIERHTDTRTGIDMLGSFSEFLDLGISTHLL